MSSQDADEKEPRVWTIRLTQSARAGIEAAYLRFTDIAGKRIAEQWQEGLETAIGALARLSMGYAVAEAEVRFSDFSCAV